MTDGRLVWAAATDTGELKSGELPRPTDDVVQQELFRDIDAIMARLDIGIAEQNKTLDALLSRLTQKAA